MKQLGLNIKHLRRQKKITQKQLAEQIGVKHSIISMYERGQKKPSLGVLANLSSFFNISMDDLNNEDLLLVKKRLQPNSRNPPKVEEPASGYELDETIRLDALERRVSELSRRLSALEKELGKKKGEDVG